MRLDIVFFFFFVGQARCSTVSSRLYDFAGHSGASDPALDGSYTATLRGQCKPGDSATLVDLDPTTPATFDADYYGLVAGKRGLLSTDAALLRYPATSAYVERQAKKPRLPTSSTPTSPRPSSP